MQKGRGVLYQHWVRFIIALQFLTRLPLSRLVAYSPLHAQKSPVYYPLAGVFIGAISYFIFSLFNLVVSDQSALLASIIATILLTGALHEDGFADCCDGFGGGWEKHDILRIMKDSRLGTYGVMGIGCILSLKYQLLTEVSVNHLCIALLLGHGLSRFFAITFMQSLAYAQEDQESKVRAHAASLSKSDLLIAFAPILLLLFYLPLTLTLIIGLVLACLYYWLKHNFVKRIGGYTGDCLGAAQQISEVVIYFCLVAYL